MGQMEQSGFDVYTLNQKTEFNQGLKALGIVMKYGYLSSLGPQEAHPNPQLRAVRDWNFQTPALCSSSIDSTQG